MKFITPPNVRKQVYKKCNGRCAYCGTELKLAQLQVDHLVPVYWKYSNDDLALKGLVRGTDHYTNLMPACRRCNHWKGDFTLEEFRTNIFAQLADFRNKNAVFKLLFDYGIIISLGKEAVIFYFETMGNFSAEPKRFVG